jgi:hypothetical protein
MEIIKLEKYFDKKRKILCKCWNPDGTPSMYQCGSDWG